MEEKVVITIGRENGSGGKYIGEELAKELGIKCYDENLISETAKQYHINEKNVEKNDEKLPQNILYFGGQMLPAKTFEEEEELIAKIAKEESCIFIGRAADYVLRNEKNVYSVFVHAPIDARVSRYSTRNNISEDKAKKAIAEQDKMRANFYKFYTNQTWGDSRNYNISIDTSKVGIDGAIEIIKNFIKVSKQDNNMIK